MCSDNPSINHLILSSYQFNPPLAKEPVIVKVLVKALTAIPAPDFNLCLYLLAEHAVSNFLIKAHKQKVINIIHLAS